MNTISTLLENLKLVEKYLTRGQLETVRDIRGLYKLKGFLTTEQLKTLERLWETAIMAGGETDD